MKRQIFDPHETFNQASHNLVRYRKGIFGSKAERYIHAPSLVIISTTLTIILLTAKITFFPEIPYLAVALPVLCVLVPLSVMVIIVAISAIVIILREKLH